MLPPSIRSRLRFSWRYLRGDAPWDRGIVPPEITAWVAAREAAGDPPGRALDLGCGTGTSSLFLAAHGWKVTGIDFAPNAIVAARRKAHRADVADRCTFRTGDVTSLDFLPTQAPFDLAIDVGCLHVLDPEPRRGYAAHLKRLTQPGTTYLLYAFMPHVSAHSGRHVGIDPAGVAALFGPEFEVVSSMPGTDSARGRSSNWYTLIRVGQP
jgi:SAM-dependent methyltransferase